MISHEELVALKFDKNLSANLMQDPNVTLFYYRAVIVDVYNGDTVTADIDLGLGVWLRSQKLRLYGINAPEVRGEQRAAGLLSRYLLRRWISGEEVIVETFKDRSGKFGRYLANILVPITFEFEDESGGYSAGWANVNSLLVAAGAAEFKEY